MNRNKLKKILTVLEPENVSEDVARLQKVIADVKRKLSEDVRIATLDEVNTTLRSFQKSLDISSLENALDNLTSRLSDNAVASQKRFGQISDRISRDTDTLKKQMDSLVRALLSVQRKTDETQKELQSTISAQAEIEGVSKQLHDVQKTIEKLSRISDDITKKVEDIEIPELPDYKKDIQDSISTVRKEFHQKLGAVGGGNANRNIAVGGNTSVLSTYTDINIKPGANVTLTYSNNSTTKYLDLTIAATGGAGTSRSISSVAASFTAASTLGTDFVYICTQGIKVDLPTAVTNSNLYTIKNAAASSVMVAADGSETIDGDANIVLQTRYTAVDLISDGANWHIT